MYSNIKTAIITYLDRSSKVEVSNIYNYEPTLPEGFPSISVTATSTPGQFADTQRNRRDYTFRLRCYMNRQTMGITNLTNQSEAERILTNLMDSLISIFDDNTRDGNNNGAYNLGGTVPNLVFVQPIAVTWGYAQAPEVDMRIADIELKATVVA